MDKEFYKGLRRSLVQSRRVIDQELPTEEAKLEFFELVVANVRKNPIFQKDRGMRLMGIIANAFLLDEVLDTKEVNEETDE
jgi:hypothetical protein